MVHSTSSTFIATKRSISKASRTCGVNHNIIQANDQAHFFHSLPAGGFTSTRLLLTSSQFVLRVVPPLSWKLFIIARLESSSASPKIFWKKLLTALSPPALGSSSVVFSFSELRIWVVSCSQFFFGLALASATAGEVVGPIGVEFCRATED